MSRAGELNRARQRLTRCGTKLLATAMSIQAERLSPATAAGDIREVVNEMEGVCKGELLKAHDEPDTRCDFVVQGSGGFPWDMLRYDDCWPADSKAVEQMLARQLRQIHMRTAKHHPTFDRWGSFNWTVIEVKP